MLDAALIGIYFLTILVVGIYNRAKKEGLDAYIHAGRDLGRSKFILTATIFVSAVGGGTTFGITEKAFNSNLAYAYGLILTIPVDILIASLLVPRLIKYNYVESIGQILETYYGTFARVATGIAAALISLGYLSVQISVSSRIFAYLFKLEYIYAVLLSYFIVIIYTSFGGFRSIVINNSLQFVAMIVGIPIVTIAGLHEFGVTEFLSTINQKDYNLLQNSNLLLETIFATLSFSVMGFYPSFIQRILIGKQASPVKKAIYYKSFVYFCFIIILSINGLLAARLVPFSDSSNAVMNLVGTVIPEGIRAIVIIGFLAAVTSTADSDLNISAISIINDIIRPLNIINSDRNLTIAIKLFSLLLGSSIIILVLKFENIVELIVFSSGFWAPTIAVPLIALLYEKKISQKGFYASIATGAIIFMYLSFTMTNPAISPIFFGVIANLLVFCLFRKLSALK